jgi:hypothetical protein
MAEERRELPVISTSGFKVIERLAEHVVGRGEPLPGRSA